MTIIVLARDTEAARPLKLTLADKSGAHVIQTVAIEGQPPIAHAFDHKEGGTLTVPLDLKAGTYKCAWVLQAFKHGALSGMYDSALRINGKVAASAAGKIPQGEKFDVGSGRFELTVT